MRVIITGGLGFVGKLLCVDILNNGSLTVENGEEKEVTDLVLFDTPGAISFTYFYSIMGLPHSAEMDC